MPLYIPVGSIFGILKNPVFHIRLSDSDAWFIPPQNTFPLLQSPATVCITPIQQTFGIAHSDLTLLCSCSAIETNFKKLLTQSSCTDVASRGRLKFCSVWCNRCFNTFVWSSQLTFLFHLQLTGPDLAGQLFHEWTCGKSVILWQCHVVCHWALRLYDSLRHSTANFCS